MATLACSLFISFFHSGYARSLSLSLLALARSLSLCPCLQDVLWVAVVSVPCTFSSSFDGLRGWTEPDVPLEAQAHDSEGTTPAKAASEVSKT